MKALISGDPHGKVSNLLTFKKYLDVMLQMQKAYVNDFVVILGDLFDNHAVIRSEVMNLWIDYLRQSSVRHILIKGNHDETAPGSNVHALAALRGLAEVIDAPRVIDGVAFVPFCADPNQFAEFVGQVKGRATVMMCHQSFDGAKYDNGMVVLDGVSVSLAKEFSVVIAGHCHRPQLVENIWYPGTPFSHSFGEVGSEKSLYLFDSQTLDVIRIFPDLPKHVVFIVDSVDAMSRVLDGKSEQDFYKIVFKATRAEVKSLQKSKEYKELRGKFNLTLCPEYVDAVAVDAGISDALSPEQMLPVYIRDMQTECDKDKILETALKFLKSLRGV